MFSNYREAYQVAKETNVKLTAYNFKPTDLAVIIHEEGSVLTFKSAFLREWKDYVFVFTEHHGFHVYHRGDLSDWRHYEEKEREKLNDTNCLDNCEFCKKEAKVEDLIYDHHPDWNQHDHEYHVYCSDCKDIESSRYKTLFKDLNAAVKPWGFIWGVDNIENIKKACTTVMKEEHIDKWLVTPSPSFPETPQKAFEDGEYDEIYLAIHQFGSGEFS